MLADEAGTESEFIEGYTALVRAIERLSLYLYIPSVPETLGMNFTREFLSSGE